MTLASTNGSGATAEEILRKSVTRQDYNDRPYPGVFNFMLPAPLSGGQDLPAFWTPARDWALYSTLFRESMWSAAISIAIAKVAAMGWEVDSEIQLRAKRAQNLFLNFDGGNGYVSGLQKHLQAFSLTDNGGPIEIVRASSAAGSRILGLVPLDTFRTIRTGDPSVPAIYQDLRGGWHEMRDHEIMLLSDMPDQSDRWYGVGHCLHRESYVRMADGSSRKIKDLVKERSEELVASVDLTGALVARKIVGWHENPINGRKWVNVRGAVSSRATGKINRNLWMTEDHPVMTPGGWVKAIDLKDGDEIVTEFPTPNARQAELIIGSVLGDMSITGTSGNARMSEGHHAQQAEWLNLKVGALSEFGWSVREYKNAVNASSHVSPGLNYLRELCYPNSGKKDVPPAVVDRYLSPLLLATWYLDDGWITNREENKANTMPRAHIGNSGATLGHTEQMADILTRNGYECRATSSRGKDNPRKDIHFTVDGSRRLFKAIAAYVPPSMRYKLPLESTAELDEFNPQLWVLGPSDRFVDKAVISHNRKTRADATVYCLDVEDTHNFISSGIVVHNCAAERAYKTILKLEAIERYVYEKVSGQRALSIYFVNGVMPQQVKDAVDTSKAEAQSKGVVTYMGATIIPLAGDIPVDVKEVPLASLPDGFNRKEEWDIALNTYARCLGIAVQDLQPLSGQGLGTGTQSQVLDEAAKGQGLAAWRQSFEHMVNENVLDDRTTFYIKTSDIRDREREAKVRIDEAVAIQGWVNMGLTAAQAINLGVDRDQLPPEYRVEDDLTPGETLSDDEKPDQVAETETGAQADEEQTRQDRLTKPNTQGQVVPPPAPVEPGSKEWREWTERVVETIERANALAGAEKEARLDAGDAALANAIERVAVAIETETRVYQENVR